MLKLFNTFVSTIKLCVKSLNTSYTTHNSNCSVPFVCLDDFMFATAN